MAGEKRGVRITEGDSGQRGRVLDSAKYGFRLRYRSKRNVVDAVVCDVPYAKIEQFAKVDPLLWTQHFEELGSALLEKAFLEGNTRAVSQILGFRSMELGSKQVFEQGSFRLESLGIVCDENDLGIQE